MTEPEELESRLSDLPDAYPDFASSMVVILNDDGLVHEVLEMLRSNDSCTTETVIYYDLIRTGIAEIVEDDSDEA